MARFFPNQLRFDVLKFQDASVLQTVLPQLNKPYYWRQLISDDDFYRDPRSRLVTYGADIKKQLKTGTNCVVALALMGKRLDTIAAKILDPFATIFLAFRDRPDLFHSISTPSLRGQNISSERFLNPFSLPSLIDFFRLVTFQELYSIFIDNLDYSVNTKVLFSSRLSSVSMYITVSENVQLCNDIIVWLIQNKGVREAESFRDDIYQYAKNHQILAINNYLSRGDNTMGGALTPLLILADERELVQQYVNSTNFRSIAYRILMKQVLDHNYRDLDDYLSDNVPDYYYTVVFTLAFLGLYGEGLDELAVKTGTEANPNIDGINLFSLLEKCIQEYNLMPEQIIARELPSNWEQLVKTTNAVYEPFMIMIGAADDVKKMKRLVAIVGENVGQLASYFIDHWHQFGLQVYEYLLTIFPRPQELYYRTPVLFETNVETVVVWDKGSPKQALIDPILPIEIVKDLVDNGSIYGLFSYLEELSTTLVIPDITSLFSKDPQWQDYELKNGCFFLRAEIFIQLPTKYKKMILQLLAAENLAEKVAFYEKL